MLLTDDEVDSDELKLKKLRKVLGESEDLGIFARQAIPILRWWKADGTHVPDRFRKASCAHPTRAAKPHVW